MVSDSAPHRILVVEDDPVVADTLRVYLERAGFVVDVEQEGLAAVGRALRCDTALVLLDWMLPGLSGPEVCRRVRAQSAVPIVMLTARTSEDDRLRGFDSGADDYVPKPFSPREVVARVQAVLRRAGHDAGPPPPAVRFGDLEVDGFRREARVDGVRIPLTPTEFRILEALARDPGRAFTREELLSRVCGPDYDGFDRAIDAHITNLRRKLSTRSGARLIQTVHGVGYRLHSRSDE